MLGKHFWLQIAYHEKNTIYTGCPKNIRFKQFKADDILCLKKKVIYSGLQLKWPALTSKHAWKQFGEIRCITKLNLATRWPCRLLLRRLVSIFINKYRTSHYLSFNATWKFIYVAQIQNTPNCNIIAWSKHHVKRKIAWVRKNTNIFIAKMN